MNRLINILFFQMCYKPFLNIYNYFNPYPANVENMVSS